MIYGLVDGVAVPVVTVNGSVPGDVEFVNGRWVITTAASSARLAVTMRLVRKGDNGKSPSTSPTETNGRE